MSHSYKISQFHICWLKSNLNFCFGSLSKQFKTRISLFPSLAHCGKRLKSSDFWLKSVKLFQIQNLDLKVIRKFWFELNLENTGVWCKSIESNTESLKLIEQKLDIFHSVRSLGFLAKMQINTFVEDHVSSPQNFWLIELN